ncbi:zinc finger and BTB domain-containing protein 26-like [Lampris incognitus]|uniref:zinc finger and BTB domain-containing protein 26-like n=1 Tax=Lampris incognitus TaxID=2546036 RepID=UPI0024B48326|nr:zinc finger and BTB domain-containing protein 26-like [Lampris incognitus]
MSASSDTLQFYFPGYGDSILTKMRALREERRFCDITLLLKGSKDTTDTPPLHFHGHRVVLGASSDFLHDQFLLHEGQSQLNLGVVQNMEVGRRLLHSCYTGMLEVPLRELVSYLTAASALQMSQVVERIAQAVSKYLNPTLAHLKIEKQSEGETMETQQPDSGWPNINFQDQGERDVERPSTSFPNQGAVRTDHYGAGGFKSELIVKQEAKVESTKQREVREDEKVDKTKVELSNNTAFCLETLDSEEDGAVQQVHTNSRSYDLYHYTGAHRRKQRPPTSFRNPKPSSVNESSATQSELADSSQEHGDEEGEGQKEEEEMYMLTTQPQEDQDSVEAHLLHLAGANLSGNHLSGVEQTDVEGLLVQRPYLCRRCDRVFQHLENYVGHLKEHRQYLCLLCGKIFSQKSNLTRHIRVHTGIKPFHCPLCHKTFSQKATLQDHLNLHTGNKPHKCNYCAVHFAHKPGLRRHLKDIHGKSSLQNVLEEIVD